MSIRITGLIGALAACLSLFTACGDSGGPLGECPPASGDQQSAGSFIFSNTCTGCHSQNLTGADRFGAPPNSNFDTPDLILSQAQEIYDRVLDRSMPPGGGLGDQQIEAVRVYVTCLEQ